jgi:HD superfamily phosphohydrolase
LAALLHDIGHCIFSHGSEFYYRTFDEIRAALRDPELAGGKPSAGEVINYCILTSNEFRDLLWDPIRKRCRGGADYVDGIELKSVAQMIIGMSPAGRPERRFQAEIVNGPLDVDKLDYLSRDSYFSGVDLAIDIDRLIPSLRVETVPGRNGVEDRRLVVDHRGIAVVEQLLFGRMVLYDTVYHHHKVRAANAALQQLFQAHGEKAVWPTRSGFLKSIEDLLDIDEYDFFGFPYHDPEVKAAVRRIRTRCLPERALVLTPRAFVDQDSYTTWSTRWNDLANSADTIDRERADEWRETVVEKIRAHAVDAGAFDLASDEIVLDVPEPPGFGRLGQETLVRIVPEYVIPLSELFPFQKVVNNYSTQYKYRSYVFAPERWRAEAAYGAFRALGDEGLQLNDLALILAHQNDARARDLLNTNGVRIPDWRKEFYAPDTNEMLVIDDENPPDSSSE